MFNNNENTELIAIGISVLFGTFIGVVIRTCCCLVGK